MRYKKEWKGRLKRSYWCKFHWDGRYIGEGSERRIGTLDSIWTWTFPDGSTATHRTLTECIEAALKEE